VTTTSAILSLKPHFSAATYPRFSGR
jgi:hypothetical protein